MSITKEIQRHFFKYLLFTKNNMKMKKILFVLILSTLTNTIFCTGRKSTQTIPHLMEVLC